MERLRFTCDSRKNYQNLRSVLSQRQPPIIPYLGEQIFSFHIFFRPLLFTRLGMYLTDLIFIDQGNKDNLNSLINFYKRRLISETIREVQQFQQQAYNLEPVTKIQEKIVEQFKYYTLTEDELYACSYYEEQREDLGHQNRPAVLDRNVRTLLGV